MAKYFGSKIFTPKAKRKDVKIRNFLWQNTFEKIFTPGAKRKDVKILNFLRQNPLDQNFHTWSEA